MKSVVPFALVGLLLGLVLLVISAAKFQTSGDVLGVSSARSEISSGVTVNSENKKTLTGTILWDANLPSEIKVVSDKYPLGEAITIQTTNQTISAVINKQGESLASSTILIVNSDTFKKLGGNPEQSNTIQATVSN